MTLVIDALGGQSRQSFDPDGNRTALIDPNNNQTDFSFDPAGKLVSQTSADGNTVTCNYNTQDLLAQMTNGRGQTTAYQYDDAGRLTGFADPSGTVLYTYDSNDNLLTVSEDAGTISREYDVLDRVVKYTDAQGNIIRYTYDAMGNLVTLTYPDGKQVHYEYDAANRLVKVTDWTGRSTNYEYDQNNRLIKTTRPNNTIETRSYDTAGQLLQLKDGDKDGQIISRYDYTYDAAGRVTAEQAIIEYPFTLPNVAMTYTSDNRLATYNGQTINHDADGNMTYGPLDGDMSSYVYDSRNRLISAGNISYLYDPENQRIGVKENDQLTSYILNPHAIFSQVLIKTDHLGSQTFYVYGLGLTGQEENGVYRTYHYDHRGSTIALTDENGSVTDRFHYGPYGELSKHEGSTLTPFLFNGGYGVMTDANGLYHMRARYYNPQSRRFINKDVLLGNILDGQSLNRYAYANGQPISYVDPFGLCAEKALNLAQNTAGVLSEFLLPDPNNPWDMFFLELERQSATLHPYLKAGGMALGTGGIAGRKVVTKAARVVENLLRKYQIPMANWEGRCTKGKLMNSWKN